MTTTQQDYRLDGIYRQRQEGFFMQRVKLPAGVITAIQARSVAAIAERHAKGELHLTTRGSIEIHWLREEELPAVKRALSAVGLTSRGACGGAVRGITCSSQGAAGFPALETLARRLQRHFAGNPRFERLPKKFKIGVEADTSGRRHLIQDVGLVFAGTDERGHRYDVYLAGGLGREPQTGFLLEAGVEEQRIIPLIEAVARVYAAHTPAGKRLKHLLRRIGEPAFRLLLSREATSGEVLPPVTGFPENLAPPAEAGRIEIERFAGHLTAADLVRLAELAETTASGVLMATANQNIALHPTNEADREKTLQLLKQQGFGIAGQPFRVCPGSHLCRAGLSPTFDIAAALRERMGENGRQVTWALSGCPNSCTQPQLADIGIITSGLATDDDGTRSPRFDLCRLGPEGLGTITDRSLTLEELYQHVAAID
ncbi:nitrite/sulfite reductase [Trichlorobacter ammonificans]|uniref:Nitrite reductase n=1 Tax=Trichlorobacter ammonificans TaxID=2916410 RepID=A0ABN8HME1_9BACT|nr:nitrite/sulfite reductase [Trichlorobacter ammonificans]CAH2032396.1 Nitrite reductase [Trichlorobacter ammonificans]